MRCRKLKALTQRWRQEAEKSPAFNIFSVPAPGGGTPYTEVYMYMLRKCPCFGHFSLSLSEKKCKFSLFVPQLNLIILSFIEEEISQ